MQANGWRRYGLCCLFPESSAIRIGVDSLLRHGHRVDVRKETSPCDHTFDSLPQALASWHGFVPLFAPCREGGPGRPLTLLIWVQAVFVLGIAGSHLMEKEGISSPGPAMIFLAFFLGAFLLVWILVKVVLRNRKVTFYLSPGGVGLIPSQAHRRLDRIMAWLTHLAFLLTWKGGRWVAWRPSTRWRSVRRVRINERTHEILIIGGPWDIRLPCPDGSFQRIARLVSQHLPRQAKLQWIHLPDAASDSITPTRIKP